MPPSVARVADASVPRSFVVTVRSRPERVVVEDVRGRRQAAAADIAAAGAQIERWLASGSPGPDRDHPAEPDSGKSDA